MEDDDFYLPQDWEAWERVLVPFVRTNLYRVVPEGLPSVINGIVFSYWYGAPERDLPRPCHWDHGDAKMCNRCRPKHNNTYAAQSVYRKFPPYMGGIAADFDGEELPVFGRQVSYYVPKHGDLLTYLPIRLAGEQIRVQRQPQLNHELVGDQNRMLTASAMLRNRLEQIREQRQLRLSNTPIKSVAVTVNGRAVYEQKFPEAKHAIDMKVVFEKTEELQGGLSALNKREALKKKMAQMRERRSGIAVCINCGSYNVGVTEQQYRGAAVRSSHECRDCQKKW